MARRIMTSAPRIAYRGATVATHVAKPTGDGPFPGVVVFHEVFGLNDDIRRIADRFASNGYVALAPDLIGGGFRCLVKVFRDLVRGEGMAFDKARAAIAFLAELPEVDDGRLGLVGFCMGGEFALTLAIDDAISVCAPNYAKAPPDTHLARLCPVVASYGARDMLFSRNAKRLERVLTAAGIDNDIRVYPDAGHSFINDHAPWYTSLVGPVMAVGYRHGDAEDAWERMLAFFEHHLPPGPPVGD